MNGNVCRCGTLRIKEAIHLAANGEAGFLNNKDRKTRSSSFLQVTALARWVMVLRMRAAFAQQQGGRGALRAWSLAPNTYITVHRTAFTIMQEPGDRTGIRNALP